MYTEILLRRITLKRDHNVSISIEVLFASFLWEMMRRMHVLTKRNVYTLADYEYVKLT